MLWMIVPTGNRGQRHRIARLDINARAGNHRIASLQALRRQNVGQLAIGILDQRNERGTVRVIFQTLDRRGHIVFATLEVDDTISLLMSTAAEPAGDAAVVVTPAGRMLALGQAFDRLALPQLAAVDQDGAAKARRDGIKMLQCHSPRLMPDRL